MNIGNPYENATARLLEDFDYLVASRRHFGGAGDLLAVAVPLAGRLVAMFDLGERLLIEVKSGSGNPWENFRSDRRAEMISTALHWRVCPLLAWWPWSCKPSKRDSDPQPIWLPVEDWPA